MPNVSTSRSSAGGGGAPRSQSTPSKTSACWYPPGADPHTAGRTGGLGCGWRRRRSTGRRGRRPSSTSGPSTRMSSGGASGSTATGPRTVPAWPTPTPRAPASTPAPPVPAMASSSARSAGRCRPTPTPEPSSRPVSTPSPLTNFSLSSLSRQTPFRPAQLDNPSRARLVRKMNDNSGRLTFLPPAILTGSRCLTKIPVCRRAARLPLLRGQLPQAHRAGAEGAVKEARQQEGLQGRDKSRQGRRQGPRQEETGPEEGEHGLPPGPGLRLGGRGAGRRGR